MDTDNNERESPEETGFVRLSLLQALFLAARAKEMAEARADIRNGAPAQERKDAA